MMIRIYLLLGLLIGIGLLIFYLRSAARRDTASARGKPGGARVSIAAKPTLESEPDRPVDFGSRMMWLAVRAEDPAKVAAAASIKNLALANWASGIASAHEHGMKNGSVFFSPSIDGWVLVVGGLPAPGANKGQELLAELLQRLSEQFGEAQFFATHRVVEWHAWAKWINGEPLRAYAYSGDSGEMIWDSGALTEAEQGLGMEFSDPKSLDENAKFPTEEDVLKLASRWSIDPTQLSSRELPASTGLYGEIADGSDRLGD